MRTLSALSTDNPEMPFTPLGIDSYAGLTGEGTSLWRDGDGNLLALEFVGGGVVRHEIALGIGPYLWLDGFAYGHDGIMVTGQGVCLDGECTGARGVGSPRPPTDFRPDYLTFPAWSPVTGGIVSRSGTDYLFAGCTDGQPHWMLRFPGLDLRGVPAGLFIRASGEILLIANEAYAISPDGEVLRQRTIFTPELGLAATSAATFIEGCGVLLAGQNSFAWLNPDSFEVGPIHTVPGGYPLVSFAATPSCHVVMIANPVTPTLVRSRPMARSCTRRCSTRRDPRSCSPTTASSSSGRMDTTCSIQRGRWSRRSIMTLRSSRAR
ncbi:MAG: hypothetical protein J0L92_32155 [Deltaproteobacteria bacterium]|nr:hypothetical protein [Deltaproteobacteria bacterium]